MCSHQDDFAAFLDELSSEYGSLQSHTRSGPAATADETRHACEHCGGTGQYRGVRIHQEKSHCFACRGRGYYKQSRQQRERARQQAASRKQARKEDAQAVFNAANPGLIEDLKSISSWNNFAASLLETYRERGALSDNAVSAAQRMLAKIEAGREARKAQRDAERSAAREASDSFDASSIEQSFARAKENGLKAPRLVFGGLTITVAKAQSRNAGALYIKFNGEYIGKIAGGRFTPSGYAQSSSVTAAIERLKEVATDPLEAAKSYGRETGTCCCCNRELTDPASVAAGIGPVCANKWF